MPLGAGTTATTTTTAGITMDVDTLIRSDILAPQIREQTPESDIDNIDSPSPPSTDYEFDESQCLFCNQMSSDLGQNLVHMSKAHGLHVETAHLLVDVVTLLGYFHLIISGYNECLYCGTQRSTRQAVQQHMMAKGHCKYDITDEDAEVRDFYGLPSSDTKEELLQNLPVMRFSDAHQSPSWVRSRKPRSLKHSHRQDTNEITDSSIDQALPTPPPQTHINADDSNSNAPETTSDSLGALSTRALKHEYALNNQLAQLREGDRRSLLHLPTAQQRALLATHHKQMEKARRTEQTNRTNLESASNSFSCLGKIRLIRKPPHTGNIHSLKR